MNISEIVKDSIKYPFSDWKKILILGIITVFSGISGIAVLLGTLTNTLIYLLIIIGSLISFFIGGYSFKIIISSLAGIDELPKFEAWIEMFINGIKVEIVSIVYLIPVFLITLVFAELAFISILGYPTLNVEVSNTLFYAGLNALNAVGAGTWALIATLYLIIITPISVMAVANMANNNSKLSAAFKLREIVNKIGNIGWLNFIKWYIVIGILYLAIYAVAELLIFGIFSIINPIVGVVLILLILTPYILMYLYRAVALIYKSE